MFEENIVHITWIKVIIIFLKQTWKNFFFLISQIVKKIIIPFHSIIRNVLFELLLIDLNSNGSKIKCNVSFLLEVKVFVCL